VSVDSAGTEGNSSSVRPAISADGRFVAFASFASNLVAGDTNGTSDIFVRDTCVGGPAGCTPSTIRVSVDSAGTEGDSISTSPSLSADGRFVAFVSRASNLVAGDTNLARDIFVRDTCVGGPAGCTPSTIRVSVDSAGTEANTTSLRPAISADGRFVAFETDANNLVAGDINKNPDVFVRDTCVGGPAGCTPSTIRVSVDSAGTEANSTGSGPASLSADGRFVAFESLASNLVAGDTNGAHDIFVRDTCVGGPAGCTPSTIRVSVDSAGTEGDSSSTSPSLSADGRFVAFASLASNLVAGDTNSLVDVFLAPTGF
jgi:Tol biopolymer transport system component